MSEPRIVGRYAVFGPIAAGGSGTIHFGRLIGPVGFSRTVAVKIAPQPRAEDADFVDAFVKQVKSVAQVKHPSFLAASDVVAAGTDLFLVMDYVPGESAARLFRTINERGEKFPAPIAAAIIIGALRGLHALHEANELHRDVSPQSILVGTDGAARLVDFRATKGKTAYSSPDVLRGGEPTRASEIWAAAVIAWELFTGKRLFVGSDEDAIKKQILESPYEKGAEGYDEVLEKALANGFASALELAEAIEKVAPIAEAKDVGAFIEENARQALDIRKMGVDAVEKTALRTPGAAVSAPSVRSVGSGSGLGTKVVFGLVVPPTANLIAPRVDELTEWLGDEVGLQFTRRDSKSYESLAMAVREGKVDVAWLPPIVYVRIIEGVTPLGSIQRGAKTSYEAALIVREDSKLRTIDSLRGARAGWVDPWSAAGFVLPRIKLSILGVDPRRLFRTEKFHGSHHAAIQALLEGACDVAGTYSRTDEKGEVVAGAWNEVEGADVRVLTTFGAIPPDVIAVRRNILPATHEKVLEGLRAASKSEEARPLLRAIFGGEELVEEIDKGYDSLRNALDGAISRGLFD